MLLLRLYRAHVRLLLDAALPLAFAALLGLSSSIFIVSGPIAALSLFTFGFYSSRYSLSGKAVFSRVAAGAAIAWAFLFLASLVWKQGAPWWAWPACISASLAVPLSTWALSEGIARRPVAEPRAQALAGSYPALRGVLADIESAVNGALRFSQGDLEADASKDGAVIVHWCLRVLKRLPVEVVEAFPGSIDWSAARWYDPLKRLADIVCSLFFLALFSPFMLAIAAAIKLEDGGPAVFSQTRVGRHGKPFTMYKFRSMKQANFLAHDPNGNIESRILKIGAFIRKTRLDETLQFFNVLIGDMSFIGPRPEMEHYHRIAADAIPEYDRRLTVKPGITGWAQTCFSHTTSVDEYRVKTSYDFYYVLRRNPSLDAQILLKTVGTVILLAGAR